jgi:excisionase family DNA binding protein
MDPGRIEELEARIKDLEQLLRGPSRIEPDVLYTVAEASRLLGCGGVNVYNLLDSGDLARTRIGAGRKGFRVRGSDLLAFLEARREGGPQPRGGFKYLKPRRLSSA